MDPEGLEAPEELFTDCPALLLWLWAEEADAGDLEWLEEEWLTPLERPTELLPEERVLLLEERVLLPEERLAEPPPEERLLWDEWLPPLEPRRLCA